MGDSKRLEFNLKTPNDTPTTNYFGMSFWSDEDEEIYGLGLQPSVWNFKGR